MESVGKSALIVEGGATRGIWSCGILDYFMHQDFNPFDSFWGVSAGASNLAAFLAQMPGRNLKVYADYSCRKEFLTPGKFLLGGDLMDLDWMWQITLKDLGIDKQVLAQEKRPFFLGVTRRDTGESEYITPSPDKLAETMKASSAVPIAYRNGVQLGQHRYVDGGVSDAIPVAEAIRRGATQIMVLRSRPASYRKSAPAIPGLMKPMLKDAPALIPLMQTRHIRYNKTLELIANPPAGVNIVQICPPEGFKVKRLGNTAEDVKAAYELGYQAGSRAIQAWIEEAVR
ncbi:patatin family protein [Shewanella corallii]|uniref:Patatin family protein n=1 Tax=Shewanella corallii TaxID=560080 RepID=A0ABT0N7X1_9GAMM|nr:patatin family protein [Shewanella corallii]MCL2914475.1 patatin family protein [Shewanella corallii]